MRPGSTRVVVGLPTYGRTDGLATLLRLVCAQASQLDPARWDARVVIVDNNPEPDAVRAIEEYVSSKRVHYVHEPTPGISAARNRAIDAALEANILVMMDDDELPEPGWLQSLLGTWDATRAAVIEGRVQHQFAGEVDPWIAECPFFARRVVPTGTELKDAYTSNILLDLDQTRAIGVRFDSRLGSSGGEDSLFTRLVSRSGRKVIFCFESVVTEFVPRDRMTQAWVVRRALRSGITDSRIDRLCARNLRDVTRTWVRGVGGGFARVLAGSLRWSAGMALRDSRHRAHGTTLAVRGLGKIIGVFGFDYVEYGEGTKGIRRSRKE